MTKFKIFLFLIFIANFTFAQSGKIINNEATSFQIKDKNDNIDFIVLDTKLESKKPVFLFCQGSLPYPLFVNSKKDGIWMIGGGVSNFDVEKIKKYYHLVVISDPKTPVIANEDQVNDSYWYFGNSQDKNIPTDDFQKADYLGNYVNRAIKVLKFLKKQKWVDNKN